MEINLKYNLVEAKYPKTGSDIKSLRKALGIRSHELAKIMKCSTAKMVRVEKSDDPAELLKGRQLIDMMSYFESKMKGPND